MHEIRVVLGKAHGTQCSECTTRSHTALILPKGWGVDLFFLLLPKLCRGPAGTQKIQVQVCLLPASPRSQQHVASSEVTVTTAAAQCVIRQTLVITLEKKKIVF